MVAVREDPEPVELYTAEALVAGFVMPGGQRLSDILNAASVVSLLDSRAVAYETDVDPSRTDWDAVEAEEVLFVTPPPHVSQRELRIHRHSRRVQITIEPFQITGTLHVRPGIALDHYLVRSPRRFIPLTSAVALFRGDPAWERVAPVVLVNAKRITYLSDLVSIA